MFIGTNVPLGDSKGMINFTDGAVLTEKAESGMLTVGMDTVKHFDEVLTGNDVFVFGYPTSLGLKSDPTRPPQFDPSLPLLRKGIVAGKNPRLHTLILDSPIYFGNSGGPALEVEQDGLQRRFRVIGVVSVNVEAGPTPY